MATLGYQFTYPSLSHPDGCKHRNQKQNHIPAYVQIGDGLAFNKISISSGLQAQETQKQGDKSQKDKHKPSNTNAYASLLQGCSSLKQVKQAHAHMLRTELDQNIFLLAKLVSMYVKYGFMDDARPLFDKMSEPNVFTWNVMIKGYAWNGPCEEAFMLYYEMQRAGAEPDRFTLPFLLKACASLSALQAGKQIHCRIFRIGLEADVYGVVALIYMYMRCGCLEYARQLFDRMPERDVVLWSAMIGGYAQSGRGKEAMVVFHEMQMAKVKPNAITMVSVIQACAQLGDLEHGKWIHDYVVRCGFESNVFVGNSLVAMYAKCGSIEIAHKLFQKMPKRDVVSWNTMITGYEQNGFAEEALKVFKQMQLAKVMPNSVTMLCVLQACAHLGALEEGKWIHEYIIQKGFESDVSVANSLITMYAKCGNIQLARQVFEKNSNKNAITWSAMIAGYGMNGNGQDALALFDKMQETGTKPNHITFVSVLSACSHAGLVDKGRQYFGSMTRDYFITPIVEHYACMVDLLGRAGHLDEAQDFVKKMPLEPAANVWGSLLGACRIHCNLELGEKVAKRLFELEPENAGYYVLLSNIYAAAGRWDDSENVRALMKDKGVRKTPGCSWVEINNRVHSFVVGDRSHPQSDDIYATLQQWAKQMKKAGYVPDTNFVLHDVEDEVKEHMLFSHSEKLAIAFSFISTSSGTPIRVTKNLRVCGDCHSAAKFISKIVNREIVVRDTNRFHHIKNGLCSCGDYW